MSDMTKMIQKRMPRYGTNTGHGRVWPRPDGAVANCGSTRAECAKCSKDLADLMQSKDEIAAAGMTP